MDWKIFQSDEEGLHIIQNAKSSQGFIICEQINDIQSGKLLLAAPELLSALKALNQKAKSLNNLQHAGVEIDSALWSDLYQTSAQVDALIEKVQS